MQNIILSVKMKPTYIWTNYAGFTGFWGNSIIAVFLDMDGGILDFLSLTYC